MKSILMKIGNLSWPALGAVLIVAALISAAVAQQYPLSGAAIQSVGSAVVDSVNGSGDAVPASAAAPLPVDIVSAPIGGYSYGHVPAGAAATHVIKAGAGTLHSITFNGPATATNVTTVYDNATGSGTVIAVPLATGIVVPVTLIFDVAFANGLTIITTTANGADMTIAYQ